MALLIAGGTQNSADLDYEARTRICFHTSMIVLYTLLINGTTVTPLYKSLKARRGQIGTDKVLKQLYLRIE